MNPSYNIKDSDDQGEAASLVANAPKAAPTLPSLKKKGWGKAASVMTPKAAAKAAATPPVQTSPPIAEEDPPPSLGNNNKNATKKEGTGDKTKSKHNWRSLLDMTDGVTTPPDWFLWLQETRMARRNRQYISGTLFVLQAVTLAVVNHGFSSQNLVQHTLQTNSSNSFEGKWISRIDESTAFYTLMNTLTGILVFGYFLEVGSLMVTTGWPDSDWLGAFGFFYQRATHQVVRSGLRGYSPGFQWRNMFRLAVLIFAMEIALTCGFACGAGKKQTSLLSSFSPNNQWLSFSVYSAIRLLDLMLVLPYAEEFWQGIFRSTKKIATAFVPLMIFLWFSAVVCQILFGMDPFVYPYSGAKIDFDHINKHTGKSTPTSKLVSEFPQSKGKPAFDQDFFSTGPKSFVTMFQLYTEDGWSGDIVRPTMALADAHKDNGFINGGTVFVLFFIYLFLAGVVVANFFTGIVVTAVEEGHKEAEKDMSKSDKREETDTDTDSDEHSVDESEHREVELAFHSQVRGDMQTARSQVVSIQRQVHSVRAEVAGVKTTISEELASMRDTQLRTQALLTQLLQRAA